MATTTDLEHAEAPEHLGLPSRAILGFLDRIERSRTPIHGLLLLRNGLVATEGYWAPFAHERQHRMYSVSKSFVSIAVGLMIDEGRFSLTDRAADLLPDLVPPQVHPWVTQTTIRDLLMMATPHDGTSYTVHDSDWARTFFEMTPSHPPGTVFNYDTAATVVLGTIVERLAGVTFLEYLRPRLLDPIGFSADAWCVETPEGTSWGGSGVICTLRDTAKVAQVCMHGGRWHGEQLLPEWYVSEATGRQIDNSHAHGNVGYGYQIWRTPESGFAFKGMGSQLAYCFPDRDFQFTCIGDTQGTGDTGEGILDAFWEELYPALRDGALPEDPDGAEELSARLESLTLLPAPGAARSAVSSRVDGMWYALEPNPMGISRLRLSSCDATGTRANDAGTLEFVNRQGEKSLTFGLGKLIRGDFPQDGYFGKRIGVPRDTPYECHASGAWVEEHKLDIHVHITDDYLGSLRISLAFVADSIGVQMTKVAEWFLEEYEGFAGGRAERP